ncbi:MAG: glycosyltransferase [Dehalococcoidia bacterium]|nr:glycosyltransferase [Dehalococcoidia bacterium]
MQVYIRELSRALVANGHHVDVFTRRASPDAPPIIVDRPGLRVITVPAGPPTNVPKTDLSFHLPAFISQVRGFEAREGRGYDVIHSHYWLSGRVGRFLRRAWGVPHVTMFHTLAEIKNRARIGERESDERLRHERLIVDDADRIVVASEHERLQLQRFYDVPSSRISVVPCGVDLELFRPGDRAAARAALGVHERYVVLFVGRLEPLKGIDILLRAVAGLDDRDQIAVLLAGGASDGYPSERERLQALVAELGIAAHTRFLGPQPQERLPTLYAAADVTVVPSYYESFGLVAIESMACGTPVIASRVGGLPSSVRDGETGYLIPWRCPEAFQERLELLLGNDVLRSQFGHAARASVERFRWSAVADQIADVYASVVADEPAVRAVRV